MAVETCTDAILAGLKKRDDATKAIAKAKAKGKAKGKAKSEPKVEAKAETNVLPTIAKVKTSKKAFVVPKPKAGEPVYFGPCTIMHGQGKWRVTTEANRRYDKGFSFKKPGAWDDLLAYCIENQ